LDLFPLGHRPCPFPLHHSQRGSSFCPSRGAFLAWATARHSSKQTATNTYQPSEWSIFPAIMRPTMLMITKANRHRSPWTRGGASFTIVLAPSWGSVPTVGRVPSVCVAGRLSLPGGLPGGVDEVGQP